MHLAARAAGYGEKKLKKQNKKKTSSYSLSNPLERVLLPLAAKHFDTSLLKITGREKRMEQNDFKGIHYEREFKNFYFRCDETFFGG